MRNGRWRIVLCPITPTGRNLAARAAAERRDVEVSGFQVWIIEGVRRREGERTSVRWMVVHYGIPSHRRTSRHEPDVNEAVARIRRRRKDAAIRLVTTSPEGEDETTAVIDNPNHSAGTLRAQVAVGKDDGAPNGGGVGRRRARPRPAQRAGGGARSTT